MINQYKRPSKGKQLIKEIAIWVVVFVIGSLILALIFNPSTFSGVKSTVSKLENKITSSVSSEEAQDNPRHQIISAGSCLDVDVIEEFGGFSNLKELACREQCLKIEQTYDFYKCEGEELLCYCKQ